MLNDRNERRRKYSFLLFFISDKFIFILINMIRGFQIYLLELQMIFLVCINQFFGGREIIPQNFYTQIVEKMFAIKFVKFLCHIYVIDYFIMFHRKNGIITTKRGCACNK